MGLGAIHKRRRSLKTYQKGNLPEQMFSVPWGPEKVHNMSFLISTSIELKVSKHVMLSIMFNST